MIGGESLQIWSDRQGRAGSLQIWGDGGGVCKFGVIGRWGVSKFGVIREAEVSANLG